MTDNYYQLGSGSLFSNEYIYIDTAEHTSYKFLEDNEVRIKAKHELRNPAIPGYTIVHCKVPKKQDYMFKTSLAELWCSLLSAGHKDYIDICENIINLLVSEQEKISAAKCPNGHVNE